MIEVEVKIPLEIYKGGGCLESGLIVKDVFGKLTGLGFSIKSHIKERDAYFDNAESFIRGSGQAFRIRIETDLETGIETSLLTFKGKRLDDKTVTRPEYETGVDDSKQALLMLEGLGYRPVKPEVIKDRTMLVLDEMTACMDKVEGLGDFLELEILVEDERSKGEALVRIEQVLGKLGYSLKDSVQTSYLSMLQGIED